MSENDHQRNSEDEQRSESSRSYRVYPHNLISVTQSRVGGVVFERLQIHGIQYWHTSRIIQKSQLSIVTEVATVPLRGSSDQ